MSDEQQTAPAPICEHTSGRRKTPSAHDAEVEHMTVLVHDLRNYLTPVYGHLTTLQIRAQHDQRDLDMRSAVRGRQALDQALMLLTNMLDTIRTERSLFDLSMQQLDLSQLTRQATTIFQGDDPPIVCHFSSPAPVMADPARLGQVLHNLLANAITYSPQYAPITVQLVIEQRSNGPWAFVRISNQGAGIPPQQLAQLFQRFKPGPQSQGLGLGLYLARGIAEAHGGTLTARSAPGAGACFTLGLPIASETR